MTTSVRDHVGDMANNASALVLRVELLERRLSGDGSAEQHIHGASDTFWLLFCCALVNFMQVGFAMLETGSVRQKNSMNILTLTLTRTLSPTLTLTVTLTRYGRRTR